MRISIVILLLSISCITPDSDTCIDKNCSDYSSQAAAQADYDANPGCRNDLDADKDGIACEDLFNSTGGDSGCPTTANCGCSNKKKDECASACCQWIVGTGCRCR